MKDAMELKRSWENYVEHRNSFVYGYSEIDLNDFADLVQDTFDFFKYVKDNYLFPGKAPKSPVDTFSFLKVLFYVSQYRNYDNAQDESENFIFTVTGLISEGLADFLINPSCFSYNADGTRICEDSEDAAKGNFYFCRDNYPYSDEVTDEELRKTYRYNVYEKDFTEILELAESYQR